MAGMQYALTISDTAMDDVGRSNYKLLGSQQDYWESFDTGVKNVIRSRRMLNDAEGVGMLDRLTHATFLSNVMLQQQESSKSYQHQIFDPSEQNTVQALAYWLDDEAVRGTDFRLPRVPVRVSEQERSMREEE